MFVFFFYSSKRIFNPRPMYIINNTKNYCSKNSNLKLKEITRSFWLRKAALCFGGENIRQYISKFYSALRLSALSLQMASQLAALSLMEEAHITHRRTTLSVCRGKPASHLPRRRELSPPLMFRRHSMSPFPPL